MASQPICANWAPDDNDCKEAGRFACKGCFLLRRDCKSPLGKKTWQPNWVTENRTPAFVADGPPQTAFGGRKYLWGNVPAFDVLQLRSNEGEAYDGQLRLLFAASGDLRNMIKTVAQLPNKYSQALEVTMNDREFNVVARNVVLLLVGLVADDINNAAECIIHVWYSALLRKSAIDILQHRIRPLIEEVCNKLEGKAANSLLAKTWTFGQRSLRLVLTKSAWDALLAFAGNPDGLTKEQANEARQKVTLAEDRIDFRDRHLFLNSGHHRVALMRFREDGLLLPFGAPRDEFHHPNPTLFQTGEGWPLTDYADPLNGWSLKEVHETSNGPPAADIYGKLFIYFRTLVQLFLRRLSGLHASFLMFNMEASILPKVLDRRSFDRIEVSNISDAGYFGIHRTLDCMIPLLQRPLVNPHATLITLFMNAVPENLTDTERLADLDAERIVRYLSLSSMPTNACDPVIFKVLMARNAVATHDRTFDRYAAKYGFSETGRLVGATMKHEHTVIDKWPFRLKLQPGQPGAQEEFDRLMGGGVSSMERYLEWKRA